MAILFEVLRKLANNAKNSIKDNQDAFGNIQR